MNRSDVTVITSSFNETCLLRLTADSIRRQSARPSWIIVDAVSTDDIHEFFLLNRDIITHFISEPDTGIFNAWNKALSLVSTTWVLFLGCGDLFYSPYTLQAITPRLNCNHLICYGDVLYTSHSFSLLRRYSYVSHSSWGQYIPMTPHHQGVFHHIDLLSRFSFDESYRIGADTKLVLQAQNSSPWLYIGVPIAYMLVGGVSTQRSSLPVLLQENSRITNDLKINVNRYPLFSRLGNYKLFLKVLLYQFSCLRASIGSSTMITRFFQCSSKP